MSIGLQQCADGTDEDDCQHLLLNECDPEYEYRCKNGMCIDQEYFLDGEYDCQDLTDEQNGLFSQTIFPCFMNVETICDEILSDSRGYFSCGDGYFIEDSSRFRKKVNQDLIPGCRSFRDLQWRCEIDNNRRMWTNPLNGHCLDYVDETNDIVEENIDCIFIIKCAIALPGQHYRCPCFGNDCKRFFNRYCIGSEKRLVAYPDGRVFSCFVQSYYDIGRHDFNKNVWPDYFLANRNIKCAASVPFFANSSLLENWFQDEKTLLYYVSRYHILPLEILFCNMHASATLSTLPKETCWNDTYPDRARLCSNEFPYLCLSKYHILDGFIDCPLGKRTISLLIIANYRYLNAAFTCFSSR